MPEDDDDNGESGARSFWSGTIAFGLVSLPVNLYSANRPSAVSFRMLDEHGTPLARRYFCTRDDTPLSRDDLVRGYEISRDEFIEVSDAELEALMPEKSRELDLRRFVPLDSINPMYFERAYFLAPDEGSSKAYRLLAKSMESMGRAGIATAVMRGKEYLVAIIAEHGILRAEILRFHDELRSPADIGLPTLEAAGKKDIDPLLKEIKKLASDTLDPSELADETVSTLNALVDEKIAAGEDVLPAPEEPESAEIIDLMQILRQSLEAKVNLESERSGPKKSATKKSHPRSRNSSPRKPASNGKTNSKMSKTTLYEKAKALDIPGRSQMSKEQLVRAIERAG